MRPLKAEEIRAAVSGSLKGDAEAVASGVSTDSRTITRGDAFFALKGANFDGHAYVRDVLAKGASVAVVEREDQAEGAPGAAVIAVKDTLRALGGLASYVRGLHKIPVVAITGSAGKTTTKEMVASILSRSREVLKTEGNKNNLIGLPMTLFRLEARHEAAVVELGISEDWEMERLVSICSPDVALITNIGRGHLKTLGSLEGVARAKGPLFTLLKPHGIKVVNIDDPWVVKAAGTDGGRVTYSMKEKADVRVDSYSADGVSGVSAVYDVRGELLKVRFGNPGATNVVNGAAAIAAALSLGVPLVHMAEGLEAFSPVKGRMGVVKAGRITVLDDTYNANPESMGSALRTLSEVKSRKVAVLGDMLELGEASDAEHAGIGRLAADLRIDVVVSIGASAAMVAEGAARAGLKSSFGFKTKGAALEALKEIVRAGDTVLVKGSRGVALEEVVEGLKALGASPAFN